MTPEIVLVLAILVVSLVLFVSEKLRMDVVALSVLGTLALTGLVTPREALAGFSNPAVVTVWAMFMLSAGLEQTGVAGAIGRQVLRLVGESETQAVAVIMVTAAVLSAFMNNIGVAALLLPVVMDIAAQTGRSPSRLLMPLAYGTLLGGLTTLIGTPPNLLISDALREAGREPFGFFDFAPVGGAVMLGGALFVALVGRRFLPAQDIAKEASAASGNLPDQYALHERMAVLLLRPGSPLVGRSLAQSRLGSATRLNLFAVVREGKTHPAPPAGFLLRAGDRLLVEGKLERFNELQGWRDLVVEGHLPDPERLVSEKVALAELTVAAGSKVAGQTIRGLEFRTRFGAVVLAIARGSETQFEGLENRVFEPGDRLLVQTERDRLATLAASMDFESVDASSPADLARRYRLADRMVGIRVPASSVLVGRTLVESRIGDGLGVGVMAIVREGGVVALPGPDEPLHENDLLLARGLPGALEVFRGLQQLDVEKSSAGRVQAALESEEIGLAEAMLSPRTFLAGQSLQEIRFRERFGLQVLAILREGRALRSNLRETALRFGDAMLMIGPRERLAVLAREPDFLVLTATVSAPVRTARAPLAALIMVGILTPVVLGLLPISIAGVVGATAMVLTGCLTMEDAYRAVEWRSIFLIAGMLPLGVAMQQTGAAQMITEGVLTLASPLGPWGVLVALYLMTAAATMIIPTAALVVLMAPIALRASAEMGISPESVMMAVAIAASASFTSPISHPANVLVMGPGGYRFGDYLKLGVPLTIVVMLIALLVLPLAWPLSG